VNIETVLGELLLEVDAAVELVLENITIDDVVQRLKPCGAAVSSKSLGKNGKVERNGKKRHYEKQVALPVLRAGAKSRRNGSSRTA
jgi:hypothetical protein